VLQHEQIELLPIDMIGVILLHVRRREFIERNRRLTLGHRRMPRGAIFFHKSSRSKIGRNPISSNTATDDITMDSPNVRTGMIGRLINRVLNASLER
jgi:hypothetical protein